MGRNTTADKKPLLEDDEQNIGNSTYLQPQAGTAGVVIPQPLSNRLLNLQGGSAAGQTTTIVLTATRLLGPSDRNPYPGIAGPITAIVEFGNGGRATRAEFDVPVGPYAGALAAASSSIEPQDGGTIITVPTSTLRVYFRYDNLLLAPTLSNPPTSLAASVGQPPVGPGGPLIGIALIPPEPVLVQAMATYFSRPHSPAYRTLTLYTSQLPPVAIQVPLSYFCLPAFTKRVKVLRLPISSALNVQLFNGRQAIDAYTLAGGSSAPAIDVMGQANVISIASVAPADTVTYLALVCEIGF